MDCVQASLELDNGSVATVTADWLTPTDSPAFGDTRLIVMGTAGSAHLRAYAGDHLLVVSNGRGSYEPPMPPGCGGFCIAIVSSSSMIVDVIDVDRMAALEPEGHRPDITRMALSRRSTKFAFCSAALR